ncbi:hypothetical protein QTP88_004068 [Uroleucon formosanum]
MKNAVHLQDVFYGSAAVGSQWTIRPTTTHPPIRHIQCPIMHRLIYVFIMDKTGGVRPLMQRTLSITRYARTACEIFAGHDRCRELFGKLFYGLVISIRQGSTKTTHDERGTLPSRPVSRTACDPRVKSVELTGFDTRIDK